jgi:hypothetical protein
LVSVPSKKENGLTRDGPDKNVSRRAQRGPCDLTALRGTDAVFFAEEELPRFFGIGHNAAAQNERRDRKWGLGAAV